MDAANQLARMIRARVPHWTEWNDAPGYWTWTSTDEDDAAEVILEGRSRRFRPISERQAGLSLGPSVDGYARERAVRIDLPAVVDSDDLNAALTVLEAAGVIPQKGERA